jgi:xylan 1,4-beta-xylosidase
MDGRTPIWRSLEIWMKLARQCGGFLLTVLGALSASASNSVVITVDAGQVEGAYTPAWNYFGADEPNYVYAANGQKLLRELSALSPAPVYFRTHNLLTTGDGTSSLKWGSTNAYREGPDGSPIYDWTITDRIFDSLLAAHVRPLVEVGFMPEALSTHPQPYRHNFPNGDVFTGWSYPPKDYDKWRALVTAWVHHLHERYGAQVDDWLWEVWNEPDIPYWHGTPEEYDKLYDLTAARKAQGRRTTMLQRSCASSWSIAHTAEMLPRARPALRWTSSAFIPRAVQSSSPKQGGAGISA